MDKNFFLIQGDWKTAKNLIKIPKKKFPPSNQIWKTWKLGKKKKKNSEKFTENSRFREARQNADRLGREIADAAREKEKLTRENARLEKKISELEENSKQPKYDPKLKEVRKFKENFIFLFFHKIFYFIFFL